MGSFPGHALPGSFFLFVGLWWGVKSTLWHLTRRNKNHGLTRLPSRAAQRRLEIIENSAIVFFSFVGILAEQFAANGPKLQLYDVSENQWKDMMNWQHSTMYMFFGLMGAVSLIVHTTAAAPLPLDRLMLCLAFFNEGFLFLYHLHGRTMLDITVHQLLLYVIFGQALIAFLEVFHRGNVILELLRSALTIVQGTWFWQIGFVLYPPRGPQWNLKDHSTVMFVVMCFSWHLMSALLFTGLIYGIVSCVVRARLKRTPPLEMGLLSKPGDRDLESEDEAF
ncbi:transmembrane protein 45A [Eucyclogobius newberryi]|uniref:transmembrane protein 45A n=1 Tax=Eucyclogobius newberryi TaxID=166745 RepID=UPI003B5C5BC9